MEAKQKYFSIVVCVLAMMMKSGMCAESQRSGCDLDSQGHQQQQATTEDGPTKEDILQMVQSGLSLSLQNELLEAPTPQQQQPPPFGPYRRRRRSFHHQGFGGFHPEPLCPAQTDQSKPYVLGSDPTGFPTDQIASELFQRSLPGSDLLFQGLARTTIDEEKGPKLEDQPFLQKGTTCPQSYQQLWTYNSVQYGNTLCWVLTNFQEIILFANECQGKPCLGCNVLDVPFSYDFSVTYQKQCLPRFRTVSLWGFCPSLPENQRIVRDRVVVPIDCSCTTVSCKKSHNVFR